MVRMEDGILKGKYLFMAMNHIFYKNSGASKLNIVSRGWVPMRMRSSDKCLSSFNFIVYAFNIGDRLISVEAKYRVTIF